jgi:hypothetical protein
MISTRVNTEEWLEWNKALGKSRKALYLGIRHFREGVLDNPYHKDSMNGSEWQRGFNQAFAEQQKRVSA